MRKQQDQTDRELLILLAVLIALALLAQLTGNSAGFDVVTETPTTIAATAPNAHRHDVSANPYVAPAHAFPRRPIPTFSSDGRLDLSVDAPIR